MLIAKIREETFNGIRLFSAGTQTEKIAVDAFPLNGAVVDMEQPPLPLRPNPLEIVVVVDVSGSMDNYIDSVKSGMAQLVQSIEKSSAKSWAIKVVGYPASGAALSGTANAFVTNNTPNALAAIEAQFDGLPRNSFPYGEPLIEALDAVYQLDWSNRPQARRAIFAFTDEPITNSAFALTEGERVGKSLRESGVDFTLLTEAPSDPLTQSLISNSGGTIGDLTDGLADPAAFFDAYGQKLTAIAEVDLDLVAQYMAANGAASSAIATLQEGTRSTIHNTSNAVSRITDVDIASESTNLARAQILQEASSNILPKVSASPEKLLLLLQGQ